MTVLTGVLEGGPFDGDVGGMFEPYPMLFCVACSDPYCDDDGIHWYSDLREALVDAFRSRSPIEVYVYDGRDEGEDDARRYVYGFHAPAGARVAVGAPARPSAPANAPAGATSPRASEGLRGALRRSVRRIGVTIARRVLPGGTR